MTKAKAAASRPPAEDQEFESLTLALDDWFDKNLNDLPKSLRQRVEKYFFPVSWDRLSADQRRSAALQWDYQNDPATEQDRQYWWNFFARRGELQTKREKWESAETPTASDLALKESRLKKLKQELDRMELQLRQARGDYYSERKHLDADKDTKPPNFIAYPNSDVEPEQKAPHEKGGRPKSPLAEAIEKPYLYFRKKGDVAILQPRNIRSFLKNFKSLANDDAQSLRFGNENISAYIAERIKEVKIPRAGDYFVITQEREEGRKINPSNRYSHKDISKLLTRLRKKYPLPS
ncbi:MAG: hypothetical protein SCH72_12465 [Desulfuromonadales bacterium]|nr:hypothetical protein [Desulfuromonadales bacterium]